MKFEVLNFDIKKGKYICIRCQENFIDIPAEKINECRTSIQHFIVEKNKLKKIIIKRNIYKEDKKSVKV